MNSKRAAEGARATDALPAGIAERAEAELGRKILGWERVRGGTNNRLYRLDTDDALLLAKLYACAPWDPLGREFNLLQSVAKHGIANVPRALLRDQNEGWAIYSFEAGERPAPSQLTADQARSVARFAASLHDIRPGDAPAVGITAAAEPVLSPARQIAGIRGRLDAYERAAADPAAHPAIQQLYRELDLRETIERLLTNAIAHLSADDLNQELPVEGQRLTSGDFGFHNLLVHGSRVVVLDWEWGGWDDPAQMVMGFVAHGGSEGLTPAAATAFLAEYAESGKLSPDDRARFEQVGRLLDIHWIAVYASALTPEAIAAKRAGTGDEPGEGFIEDAIGKLRRRLKRAEDGEGYRFAPR